MRPDQDWESFVINNPGFITYQLLIDLAKPRGIDVGRLGYFDFPEGRYVYTGSARSNLVARVRRHLLKIKSIRWHIDYLLEVGEAKVDGLFFSDQPECWVNQQCGGEILTPGFGASDCKVKCCSHLKYLGEKH